MATRIDNLCYLRVKIGDEFFKCISKNLPAFKDASTWNILTDDPDEKTGVTYKGKSEGMDVFSITIPTDFALVYEKLKNMLLEDKVYTLYFCYYVGGYTQGSGSQTPTACVAIPDCYICGVAPGGGENNGNSTTEVKFQPRGGKSGNLPVLGSSSGVTGETEADVLQGSETIGEGSGT